MNEKILARKRKFVQTPFLDQLSNRIEKKIKHQNHSLFAPPPVSLHKNPYSNFTSKITEI